MVAPAYTEISHFRAPYKNWPHLGVGQAPAAARPAMITAPGAQAFAPFMTDANGVRVFQPQVADAVLTMLQGFSVIFLTPDSVKIEPAVPGDVREKASAWVSRKLGEGKSIIAGSPAGIQAFITPVLVDRTLEAVKGLAGEKEKAGAGTLALTALLARPKAMAAAGLMGPIGIAAIALVVVGGIAYFAMRKPRRAKSNRRRAKSNRRRRYGRRRN